MCKIHIDPTFVFLSEQGILKVYVVILCVLILKVAIFVLLGRIINLTTVSKNTYVTGFLGSFQTPNPHIPPYNKYVTYADSFSSKKQSYSAF